jgi:oxygen-independent coproporphyrinogen-3 oxidase
MIKGIYIHVPFCIKKCSFCDFSIYAIGSSNFSHNLNIMNQYTTAIITEIDNYFSQKQSNLNNIDSIYFGGGTPTLLPKTNIERIISSIYKYLPKKPKEISIESDPKTFNSEDLEALESLGFNRLTMGIQTLDVDIQQSLNRSHSIKDVYESLEIIKSSNLLSKNFGVDLIQGLPNQSVQSAISDIYYLSKIVNHISIYSLTLEHNSSLYNRFIGEYKTKEYQDKQAEMFIQTHHLLNNNFNHYEISNYALYNKNNDHKSIHNQLYWNFENYKGFGLSSASKIGKFIYKNPSSFKKYFDYVNNLTLPDNNKYLEVEEMNYINYYKYLLINSFRVSKGTDFNEVQSKLNEEFLFDQINIKNIISMSTDFFRNIAINKYEGLCFSNNQLVFTTPEVFMLSDEILIELLIFLNI